MTAGIPKELSRQIYRREGYMCAVCGSPDRLCIHHYIPRGRGGRNHPHNLIVLCFECHLTIHGDRGRDARMDMQQAATEYLADYYAEWGVFWNPHLKPGAEPVSLDTAIREGLNLAPQEEWPTMISWLEGPVDVWPDDD